MLSFLLALPTTLNFDGTSSSIVFDNSARITATCGSAPPSPPFSPEIIKMSPRSFTAFAGADVTLQMRGVPLSCANSTDFEPCALPFGPADEAGWFCHWQSAEGPHLQTDNAEVVGPLAASIFALHEPNITFIHAAYSSPCATGCELLPANVVPILKCPLPANLTGLLPGGVGTLEVFVSYFAPPNQSGAVDVPFVGRGNRVFVSLSSPSPPSPPSPPPAAPPPPPAPPPAAPMTPPPWYSLTTASANAGTDLLVRMFPIYMGAFQGGTWDFPAYRDACSAAGFRVWYDANPNVCSENTYSNPPVGGCSGKIIYDICAHIYRLSLSALSRALRSHTTLAIVRTGDVNLGGQDILGTKVGGVMQGNSGESGHEGGVMIDRPTMLQYMSNLQVPVGTHRMGAKYAHTGYSESGDVGYLLEFTIDSSYASFSGVAAASNNNPADIYLCACVLNEDCPEHFT
jgi:hypothetical protein